MSAVARAQIRAVSMNPMPGNHSGKLRKDGKKSTRKAPGTVAALKLWLAFSIRSTNGSASSCTSMPYVNFRMIPPASLYEGAIKILLDAWIYRNGLTYLRRCDIRSLGLVNTLFRKRYDSCSMVDT